MISGLEQMWIKHNFSRALSRTLSGKWYTLDIILLSKTAHGCFPVIGFWGMTFFSHSSCIIPSFVHLFHFEFELFLVSIISKSAFFDYNYTFASFAFFHKRHQTEEKKKIISARYFILVLGSHQKKKRRESKNSNRKIKSTQLTLIIFSFLIWK